MSTLLHLTLGRLCERSALTLFLASSFTAVHPHDVTSHDSSCRPAGEKSAQFVRVRWLLFVDMSNPVRLPLPTVTGSGYLLEQYNTGHP